MADTRHNKNEDPNRYDDIIRLERPVSSSRVPMSKEMRAAQFAPFAALTGHDSVLEAAQKEHEDNELFQ